MDDIKEEQEELWILVGGKLYIVSDKDKINLYLRDLDKSNPYIEDFKYDDLAWDFPLYVGKKYDLLDMFVDGGSRYSYNITDKQKISISGIIDNKECYKREMLTNPDDYYTWFCPGVGIVEEGYVHNGTVLNFNYKLKHFYIK